jgi:hypothetical protein
MKLTVSFSHRSLRRLLGALVLIAGLSLPAFAIDESKQYVRVTNTQHADLPANGTVRVTHSIDEVTMEGWDQPGVEITTIKSTWYEYGASEHDRAAHELDRVKITAEQKGGELVVATVHPRTHPVTVHYSIKVPRNAHVIVDGYGEVHFDGIAGDIEANMHKGTITVRLANDAQYAVDAHTKLGAVISDFPGDTKRHRLVGHDFTGSGQAPHKLVLKEGYGDIVILKAAAPVMAAPKS